MVISVVSVFEYLLQQPGIDVDVQDVDLYTPLMLAAHKGNKHIVKMLLEAGADQFKTSKHFHLNLNAHRCDSANDVSSCEARGIGASDLWGSSVAWWAAFGGQWCA